METLPQDWLTKGLIDFEYKKYVLLAYLKSVRASFDRLELYPSLADLIFHYRNLLAVKENKTLFKESFPKEISLEEMRKLELSYREIVSDDAIMRELESIIEFAIPQVKESIQEGTFIYDYVESQCEISPVGLTPLYAKEGYLFITQPPEQETDIYRYSVSIFEEQDFRGLQTRYMTTLSKSTVNTYERMKLDLVKQYRDLPNPAAYLVLSKTRFPKNHTLLPVVKRVFIKHLSKAA